MSRQGHNAGRKCVPHTPAPVPRQGRNAGVFQHIPSMRSRRARRDGALLTVFRHGGLDPPSPFNAIQGMAGQASHDGGLLRQPPTNGNNQSHRQSSPAEHCGTIHQGEDL
ncbi:MAG: hypothetical protein LBS55_01950 [Prevotellaceae bacterium]|nr:hypothetical protein [Prevotellaceae bacterium]